MIDKEQIRKNIEHIVQRKLNLLNGDVFDLTEETEGLTNEIIDSLQEEPVSEALKDMPKWERATEDLQIGCLVWDELRNIHLYMDRVSKGELYISMADILRLPGSPKEGED